LNLTATRSGRRFVFGALYLSEGAPIGFIWWALPTVLAAKGETVGAITTFTALLVWPWALKFLWAPLVDALRGPWFGYRQWIIVSQLAMGAAMLPLMVLEIETDLDVIFWLLMAHALAATFQDVAIDAWAIRITPQQEHGRLNASMAVGKYIGRWLFGAGVLIAWAALGRATVIAALVASIWATMAVVLMSREPDEPPSAPGERMGRFGESLRAALGSGRTWAGMMIAAVGGAAFEALGAVAGPMLIAEGFAEADVGWWRSGWVAAMIVGALVGGRLCDQYGHRRAVIALLWLMAAMVGLVAAVDALQLGGVALAEAITLAHLGMGLFIAATYALFMDLTDPRIGGTQFSAYMGATNGCEMWAALIGGRYIAWLGYAGGLTVMAGLSLVALAPLWALRRYEATRREA